MQSHERLELTQGINEWAEVGFYLFSSIQPDGGWQWVGDHIRPIVDRKIGPWYLAFNPALDRWFHGPGVNQGVTFSPNAKVSYDFTKKIAGGLEYYAAYGSLSDFAPLRDQQQQFFPAIDIDFAPE